MSDQHNLTQSILASQNGNDIITPPIILSPDNGKVTSINEGNEDLHGDWLVVTRKKKTPINPALNSAKTVNYKANRFSALSISPQKVKPGPHSTKPSPRPNLVDTTHASSISHETKRRRSDDINNDNSFDPNFDPSLFGPTRTTKPSKATHVTYKQMEISSNLQPTITSNTQAQLTNSNPTFEPNSTLQITTSHHIETNSNNQYAPPNINIVTTNENTHVTQINSDEHLESSVEHHDSREEDMVT